jgi:hypothetical protein
MHDDVTLMPDEATLVRNETTLMPNNATLMRGETILMPDNATLVRNEANFVPFGELLYKKIYFISTVGNFISAVGTDHAPRPRQLCNSMQLHDTTKQHRYATS